MNALVLILAALVSALPTVAQSTQPCSDFSIEAVEKVDPGSPIVVTARTNTSNVSLTGLRFNWSVSAGTIMAGQGTSTITIDTTGLGGQSITATVELVTREGSCSIKSKAVEIAAPPIACGLAFDQYGDLKWEDEKARLDNFAIQLTMQQQSLRGALLTYAGNPTYKGETAFQLRRAKNYLVNVRGIAPERLITIDGGYGSDFSTYLYIVPAGATLPVPDTSRNLPLSQIRFTKRKPGTRRK